MIYKFKQFESMELGGDQDKYEADKDKLSELFDRLVPGEGKADTVEGEIVRAINRVLYRWYNDGDKFFYGYGKETVGNVMSYLVGCDDIPPAYRRLILNLTIKVEDTYDDDSYWGFLKSLTRAVVSLLESGQLGNRENTVDSVRFPSKWEYDDTDDDQYQDYDEDLDY
jgi:hypothetical protein